MKARLDYGRVHTEEEGAHYSDMGCSHPDGQRIRPWNVGLEMRCVCVCVCNFTG